MHPGRGLRQALDRGHRRQWAAGLGVAVVLIAALVVLDQPTHTTTAYQRAGLSSYLVSIEGDISGCNSGLADSIKAAVATLDGSPAIQPGAASTFTSTAIADCSFTNNGVVDIADLQPPHGIGSPTIDAVAPKVAKWVFPDAFTLLQDLAVVLSSPRHRTARRAFTKEVGVLEAERHGIETLVRGAERGVGSSPKQLPLTSVTVLLKGDRLPPAKAPAS